MTKYRPVVLVPDFEAFKTFNSPTKVTFQAELSMASHWLGVRPLPEYLPERTGWPAFLVQKALDEIPHRYEIVRAVSSRQIIELEDTESFLGACPWRGEMIYYYWRARDYSPECPPEESLPVITPLVEYLGFWR